MKTSLPVLRPLLMVLLLAPHSHLAAQEWTWVKAGDPGIGIDYSIAVDQKGNTFFNGGNIDRYLAKFDPSGNLLWRRAGYGRSMATDDAGNLTVVGSYYGQIFFGEEGNGITLENPHTRDAMFLAKFDPNGNVLWARQTGGWLARGQAVAVDHDGTAYVTGEVQQWAVFSSRSAEGSNDLQGITVTDPTFGASYLAKYSSSGDVRWAQIGGGSALAIATNGDLIVAGSFNGTRAFDETRSLTSTGWSDLFVAQYTPDGKLLWVRQQNLAHYTSCNSVAVDPQGNIYVKGEGSAQGMSYDYYLLKYSPDGQALWTTLVHSYIAYAGFKFGLNSQGEVYVVGEFSNSISFGDSVLFSHGPQSDFFIAKYDNDGKPVWAKGNGGINMERDVSVAAGPNDDVWVAGGFYKETTLGGVTLTATSWKPFLARMNMALPSVVVQPANVRTNPGATVSFCATITNATNPMFQWMKDGKNLITDDRIMGTTSTCLTILDVQTADLGKYSLLIQSDNGSATTDPANLWLGPLTEFVSKTMLTNGIFQVDFVGEPGRFYNIEASSDASFLDATYITNFFCGEGIIRIIDWDGAQFPSRFYRAVSAR